MPLDQPVRYRYKKGTKLRMAFARGTNQIVESKNMATGATHTPAEFAADRKKRRGLRTTATGY